MNFLLFLAPFSWGTQKREAAAPKASGCFMGGTCAVREEPGKQKPRSCRAQEFGPKQCPGKCAAEKDTPTPSPSGLEAQARIVNHDERHRPTMQPSESCRSQKRALDNIRVDNPN